MISHFLGVGQRPVPSDGNLTTFDLTGSSGWLVGDQIATNIELELVKQEAAAVA
jgi:hypothetical protein